MLKICQLAEVKQRLEQARDCYRLDSSIERVMQMIE